MCADSEITQRPVRNIIQRGCCAIPNCLNDFPLVPHLRLRRGLFCQREATGRLNDSSSKFRLPIKTAIATRIVTIACFVSSHNTIF
jgi:hypothetical protein